MKEPMHASLMRVLPEPATVLATAALTALAVLLPGCATYKQLSDAVESKTDYKSAGKSLPPLEIPPDLTRPSRDDRFAIPERPGSGSASTTFSDYAANRGSAARSGEGDILPDVSKVRMERAGTQRWLVVPQAPEKVWPVIKEFWQSSGFLVNVESPETGVMETDWAENRAKIPMDMIRNALGRFFDQLYSSGERDKFRVRLERSSDGSSTEIYLSHRGLEEVLKSTGGPVRDATPIWQPRASDPDLEAEFLRRIAMRFGVDDARARSLVATGSSADRAKLGKAQDGAGIIDLEEPFDRAWRRVGLALDRVGFTVEDRDRSKGYYFVRYVDPDVDANTGKKDDSFLGKLAFWRSSKPDPNNKPEQFRVLVKNAPGDSSQVSVLTKDGANDKSDTATRILSLLHTQLK
jgi:outer membrane protein assembly factor BamC